MLEKLKDYKELIAIIVFFLGGFVWLQTQFPNKNDLKSELGAIRCQLNQYMKLTQLQILSQEQERQLLTLKGQLSSAKPEADDGSMLTISPAMKIEIDQLKLEYSTMRNQLGQTTSEMAKIRDELARGVCGKVEL